MSDLSNDDKYTARWALLFQIGLYKPVPLSESDLYVVAERGDRYDAYCVACGKECPVQVVSQVTREVHDAHGNRVRATFLDVEVACTRAGHRMHFYFANQKDSLTKIGQHPSLADIGKGDLGRIRKAMDEQDQDDLVRADGLHAHGIGAGSFVYLRRIVERFVVKAEKAAGITNSVARFADRIKAAREHLPEFLAENGPLYGILSKGVHELTEDECEEAFPVVRAGIEQVFVDLKAKMDRDEARQQTGKALNDLHSKLAQRTAAGSEPAKKNGT